MGKTFEKIKKLSCNLLACGLLVASFFACGVKVGGGEMKTEVVKAAEAGEILPVNHDLSKQDIPVMNGSNVGAWVGITVVNEESNLDDLIDLQENCMPDCTETHDENFRPETKKWNGIPSVIQAGNNLFIAYYTGGKGEPSNHNYISIAASTDLGKTWQNPWMTITASPRGLVWPLFFYNGAGELCMTFGDNKMTGTQMMKFYNADGPLDGIRYTAPVKTGPFMSISCKPTLISDGSLLSAYGTKDTIICRSTDGGASFVDLWTMKSTVDEEWRTYAETVIVEKKDGTLWSLRRLEYAMGIEQSFSYDNGRTWTTATNDLPIPPFYSPGSRFHMARLQSGALLFVTNMAGRGTDRREMTVWLSENDGETWPYKLELDPTQSSYPDFYQGTDGTIYLVHDRDRYGEGGIRLHTFTEEDVKAGAFISEKARQGISITKKDNEYGDIVSVNGAYQRTETYPQGTEITEILGNKPTTITVTDDNGKEYTLKGKYRISGYDKEDVTKTYRAYFVPSETLPLKLKDGYNMLSFKVVLTPKAKKSGCKSAIGGSAAVLFSVVIAIGAVALIKQQNHRRLEK